MTSSIPTLEALAERLESNTRSTIAALESQAKSANLLSQLRHDYDTHVHSLEASLEGSDKINAKTIGERAAQMKRLTSQDPETIRLLDTITANERIQTRRAADIEGYRIDRALLQSLLRIREMADTAERAQGRYRRERRAWKRGR